MWIWFALLLVLGGFAFVRLAPLDVAQVHQPIAGTQDKDGKRYCLRVVTGDCAVLDRIDTAMRALPRTQSVAGSLSEGRMTYVTRSAFFGFPDYTTVEAGQGQIKLFARARFGRADMGVNKARVGRVLEAAQIT